MKYLFLGLIFTFPVMASQFPVISSLSVAYTSDGAIYTITQKVIDIGIVGDQSVPYDNNAGLLHKHYDNGNFIASVMTSSEATQLSGDTYSAIGLRSYNNGGSIINSISHQGENGFPECVAYGIYPKRGAYKLWSSVILPAGCLMVPPADDWCKITTPEILLDHGTMTLKDAEGSSASSTVGVQCTTPTSVAFNLITNDTYVYLDEGKSEILVDNKPLNTKIDLDKGDSQLAIKDKLTGINSEGAHTGSSVLVMMPY